MTAALRIGLSAQALPALAPAIADVLGARAHELLSFESLAGAAQPALDIAFMSRDVTGLSTKHALQPATAAAYELLRRSPRLRWVQIHAAGADRPIYVELRARGVSVSTASGVNADAVAQTALAGLLALARGFPQLLAAQRERRWAPLIQGAMPRELRGQTALLLGWGPIGRRLGGLLQALGLKLVVVRQSAMAAAPGVPTLSYADWRQALPTADWLLLTCPLSEQTRALVDADALALLPAGARVINVARGEIVVEADLIAALQSGRLGGAYLDVFEHEPLPAASPLWNLDNVIVTPHSAGHSDGNERQVAALFIDNLRRWCADPAFAERGN